MTAIVRDLCVLVPAKDEERVISDTIRSLFRAGVAEEDIYIVDDGSSDKTGYYAGLCGVNVLRNEKNLGKARSVSAATQHFRLLERYQYIAMLDADTLLDADYFSVVKSRMQQE